MSRWSTLALTNTQVTDLVIASRLLVNAYRRGEQNGGSVDWEDLDAAHDAAVIALAPLKRSKRFDRATAR